MTCQVNKNPSDINFSQLKIGVMLIQYSGRCFFFLTMTHLKREERTKGDFHVDV